MAVPKFQEIMLPMLRLAADEEIWSLAVAREELARHFQLTSEEQEEMLPSGRQARFANRVAWSKVYLERGGLLASPERAHFQITERGKDVLSNPPDGITIDFLSRYPEFQEFRNRTSKQGEAESQDTSGLDTPEEVLESAYVTIRKNLASDILERVKRCNPRFFEYLVVDLLLKMGYGRAGEGAGARVGQSGDEGIDGMNGTKLSPSDTSVMR